MLYKQASALLISIATMASAAPTVANVRSELPEVIPGPGLPSLESLGLNSTYLYSLGKPENRASSQRIYFHLWNSDPASSER
jgi:hypothetical protein